MQKPTTSTGVLLFYGRTLTTATLFHWTVAVLCTFYVYIHIYIGFYGSPDSLLLNSLHVTTALAIVFMTMPMATADSRWHVAGRMMDILALVATVWCAGYFIAQIHTWSIRTLVFRPVDYVTAVIFTALVLEACRRAVGMILVAICVFLMMYALTADHFGGMFFGPPVTWTRLLQTLQFGSAGIFGVAVSVMVQYVVLFILFGILLNVVGGGRFFTRIAFALFGHRRGGPAKAAVVSSGLLGTMSGSAIGNVVTTGIFTIPLMIRLGYKRAFAGGVEAAASNGGMIMPPVMGAVAFIMADIMGVRYIEIVFAALIPAIIYYGVMFVTIDLEARKLCLMPLRRESLPSAWAIMKKQWFYLLPIVVIAVALAMGYSVILVATLTIITTFVIGVLQRRDRLDPVKLLHVVEETARSTAGLSATAAAAGIMMGAIFAVGLSYQVSQEAARIADGNILFLVLLCGVMAIIMGMGMSAAAVYLTLAATIVPILEAAGIPKMAAHFYAFYYGIASNITPPIALTAYAAAPIAGSKPIDTGVHASRIGISCLLLPILFIYQPAILLEGTWLEIVHATAASSLALTGFAVATTGYLFRPLTLMERCVVILPSALLFDPGLVTDLLGLGGLALFSVANWMTRDRKVTVAARREVSITRERQTWFARWMQRRMAKEMEPSASAIDTQATSALTADALIRSLVSDDPEPAAQMGPPFTTRSLALAWAVVIVVALMFEYAGQTFLHARSPELWTLLMAVASGVTVTGIWLVVVSPGAEREPERSPGLSP